MRYSTAPRITTATRRARSGTVERCCLFADRPPARTDAAGSSTSTTMAASDGSMPFTRWAEGLELPAPQTLLRTVRGPEPPAGTTGRW